MNGRELLRLLLAQICVHSAMTGARLAAPLRALQLGQSAAEIGVLLAIPLILRLLTVAPFSAFVGRRGWVRNAIGWTSLASAALVLLLLGQPDHAGRSVPGAGWRAAASAAIASSIAARLTGFETRPANRPLSDGARLRKGTTLKPSWSSTKSSLAPACRPSAVRTSSGMVIWPLLVRVAVGMVDSLRWVR